MIWWKRPNIGHVERPQQDRHASAGRRYYESFCTVPGQVDRVADLILERLFAQ